MLEDIIGHNVLDETKFLKLEKSKDEKFAGIERSQVIPDVDHARDASGAAKIADNMERWFSNPWSMVEDGVIYTLDSADLLNPIKKFPDEPWLEDIVNEWQTHKLLSIFKSRRMKLSWLMVFLHLHMAMFRPGAQVFFVSSKEEKSDELVTRAHFIYKHIPDDVMIKPKAKSKYRFLEFPGLDSFIMGVPQGPDQLRQYTASAILADEIGEWEYARDTFGAMKPTIEGGGRITCVSTVREGFWKELCFDELR